jgi:nucleotide-binding universal stress UspA family protein
LLSAINDAGADLVVMASHVPGLTEYVWPSHGGKIASHSTASVFVIR